MTFDRIQIEDKPLFDQFLSMSPYVDCEYLFSTLFMWQDVLGYQRAIEDDCIFIRHAVKGRMQYHIPICAPDRIPGQVQKLLDTSDDKLELFCVTKEQLEQLGPELRAHFTMEERRDFADYLYQGEDLRQLAGKKYHQKRNHIRKFRSAYDWDFRIFTQAGRELTECIDVLEQWDRNKLAHASGQERLLVGNEMNALDKCMNYFTAMGLIGGVLYIDGQPKGFTIGEIATRGGIQVGVVHYEKCDSDYAGIYQTINQLFAERALGEVTYINREDDMGVAGLRKSKLTYHPVRLVEKYILKEI